MADNQESMDSREEIQRLQQMMNRMSCNQPAAQPSLKDYTINKALGKGAYGNVYSVRSKADGQDYALKMIQLSANREGIPQSVLREISVMKSCAKQGHPNIVLLKSVFHVLDSAKGILRINMVMEKCDWDLHTFVRNVPRTIPEHQIKHIASQIAKGLNFLHVFGVIHRDLKPQNILINRDQSVKLADFGLSKTQSNTTAFTTLVVTLWYRAPEVLLQSFYTSSVDMWSLGCIVSEIYSRQALFSGQNEAEQLADIFSKIGTPCGKEWPQASVLKKESFKNYPKQNVRSINPKLTSAAADFIHLCLKYDPNERISARAALEHEYLKPATVRRVLKPNHTLNNQSKV